jgi:hypothetical protein
MLKAITFLLILMCTVSYSHAALNAGSGKDTSRSVNTDTLFIMDELSKMYRSSMVYIFKNQTLINQKKGDKSKLFGSLFIKNVKQAYQDTFEEQFPKQNHPLKKMLVQVMVEVMEDNRTLINDADIGFKGFIPAIFAFQLSEKLSTKGLGVKIKFTNTADAVRNKLNTPDNWETSAMEVIQRLKLNIYFDDTSTFEGKPAYRHFVPIELTQMCLNCHGTPKDNPSNTKKDQSQWTSIDATGFEM